MFPFSSTGLTTISDISERSPSDIELTQHIKVTSWKTHRWPLNLLSISDKYDIECAHGRDCHERACVLNIDKLFSHSEFERVIRLKFLRLESCALVQQVQNLDKTIKDITLRRSATSRRQYVAAYTQCRYRVARGLSGSIIFSVQA